MMPSRSGAQSLHGKTESNEPNQNHEAGETGSTSHESSSTYSPDMADTTTKNNTLSSDVEIKGTVKFQNDLTIDGKMEGEISSTNGTLTVGQNAEIRVNEVKTKSIVVHGRVNGNILVEDRCELKAHAQLYGDLKAARLSIEEGATFVGKSEVTPNKVTQMKPEIVREQPQHRASGR